MYYTDSRISALALSETGDNSISMNGSSVDAVRSVSGHVDDDGNLVITVNGVSGAGIPLGDSVEIIEVPSITPSSTMTATATRHGQGYLRLSYGRGDVGKAGYLADGIFYQFGNIPGLNLASSNSEFMYSVSATQIFNTIAENLPASLIAILNDGASHLIGYTCPILVHSNSGSTNLSPTGYGYSIFRSNGSSLSISGVSTLQYSTQYNDTTEPTIRRIDILYIS